MCDAGQPKTGNCISKFPRLHSLAINYSQPNSDNLMNRVTDDNDDDVQSELTEQRSGRSHPGDS